MNTVNAHYMTVTAMFMAYVANVDAHNVEVLTCARECDDLVAWIARDADRLSRDFHIYSHQTRAGMMPASPTSSNLARDIERNAVRLEAKREHLSACLRMLIVIVSARFYKEDERNTMIVDAGATVSVFWTRVKDIYATEESKRVQS